MPKQNRTPNHSEILLDGAAAFSFERHWNNAKRPVKESYSPKYCQAIVDFFVKRLKEQLDLKTERIPPPHISEFARSICVPSKRIEEWALLFADFASAVQICRDIHREMLLNGSLIGRYSGDISKLILNTHHGIIAKAEIKETESPALPASSFEAIQHIMKQHGLPPVEIKKAPLPQ